MLKFLQEWIKYKKEYKKYKQLIEHPVGTGMSRFPVEPKKPSYKRKGQ